jgi:glycosyltransferase involved in cell wall biosynthesis
MISDMNVLAIISRDLQKGSTKYRLAQYMEFLNDRGTDVEYVKKDAIDASILERARQADVLFNQKCLFRYNTGKKLLADAKRAVFDFDDAIYTRPGRPYSIWTRLRVRTRLHLWLKMSHAVTVSNHVLASYARRYSDRVDVIPMALDLKEWTPKESNGRDTVVIGWAGAPVNVNLIESLEGVLAHLTRTYPFVKVKIFSGQRPRFDFPFEHVPFRPGGESGFVRRLDVGLLPLMNDEYARGKSPIKAIQYLACGVPVVGNVVGATREILHPQNSIAVESEDQWVSGLERLIRDRDRITAMGRAGREHVERYHDKKLVGERFYQILAGQ